MLKNISLFFFFLTGLSVSLFSEPTSRELTIQLTPPTHGSEERLSDADKSQNFLSALNMWINSISRSPHLKSWDEKVISTAKSGAIKVDVGSTLSETQLKFFKSNNPYNCFKEKNAPLRMDWLTAFSFGGNYYEALGLDMGDNGIRGVKSLEDLLGLKFDFTNPLWSKALYGKGESRITRYRRAVMKAHSPKLNSDVWVTIDQDLEELGEAVNPFEIQPQKREKTVAAGELIASLPNGMPLYALITRTPEGNLILADAAPANLVTNNFPSLSAWKSSHFLSGKGENPATINNAYHCQTCHRGGLIGPQRGLKLKEEDIKQLLKNTNRTKELDQFKQLNEEAYEQGVQKNSEALTQTLKNANAFVPDPKTPAMNAPFVADITTEYNKPLDLARLSEELGTTPSIAKQALAIVDRATDSVPLNLVGNPPALSRGLFETHFCELKKAVETLAKNINSPRKRENYESH